jgi:hypothetical protein
MDEVLVFVLEAELDDLVPVAVLEALAVADVPTVVGVGERLEVVRPRG